MNNLLRMSKYLAILFATLDLCASATIQNSLVHFKVSGIDGVQVLPGKQGTDDIFHNFAFWYPSEELSDFIVSNGVGTFMNISYANLFLRVSVDHSFMYVVSDYCKNCGRNILLNVSHSLTGDVYNFESSECWSNSFAPSQLNVPQCEVKLNYGNTNIVGLLGYDTIYITAYAKSFILPNIVYVSSQDQSLINFDLNGIMGLGPSDADGAYGISLIEELLNNNVMDTPLFSFCLDPIGDGFMFLSAYGNGSMPFDQSSIVWFEQRSSYMYTLDVPSVSFVKTQYKLTEENVQFTLNIPYLLLPQEMFSEYTKQITDYLCTNGDNLKQLCESAYNLLVEEGSLRLSLDDAQVLKTIPPFVLHAKGRENKKLDISIRKLFAICPAQNRDYFSSSIESISDINICSMVRLNKDKPQRMVLGNIAHSEQGNLYIFDKRRGLVGVDQKVNCYHKPTPANMVILQAPASHSLVGQILIILGFCTLLVLSLNKCDEYFYQEEDGDPDEGASLNFMTHNQTPSDITDHNVSQNAR